MSTRQQLNTQIDAALTSNGQRSISALQIKTLIKELVQSMHCHDSDGHPAKHSLICHSGRWYCYTDNRWITNSDDNYGPAYYQFNESGGTGADPLIEWEHQGDMLPADTVIKSIILSCRTTSVNITDFEFVLVRTVPEAGRAESGVDADAEDVHTEVYRNFWWNNTDPDQPTFTGDTNDIHIREIPINVTLAELNKVGMYIKPVGTITATSYVLMTWTLVTA